MKLKSTTAFGALVAVVFGAGCKGPTQIHGGGENCQSPVSAVITPSDTAIVIGSVFQPRANIVNCAGVVFNEDPHWVAADTSIVSVNAIGGLTGGKAIGETEIRLISVNYGQLGKMTIRVEQPKEPGRTR